MGVIEVLVAAALLFAVPGSTAQQQGGTKTMTEDKRDWGEPMGGCRVSIVWLPSSETEFRSYILDIVFRNDGTSAVQFPRSSMWFDYDFSVRTDDGVEVPLTEFGEQQRENLGAAAAAVMEVQPGEEYRSTVELSLLYELDRPGTYSVQASKTFRDPKTHQFVTAVSNRLPLKITTSPGRP